MTIFCSVRYGAGRSLLSLRDRSLVTVVSLMAQGLVDSSFRYHLETARKNGITRH